MAALGQHHADLEAHRGVLGRSRDLPARAFERFVRLPRGMQALDFLQLVGANRACGEQQDEQARTEEAHAAIGGRGRPVLMARLSISARVSVA